MQTWHRGAHLVMIRVGLNRTLKYLIGYYTVKYPCNTYYPCIPYVS